jgi:two-component system, NarL family, nitrate/nitrite response regulator NarL
MSVLNLKNKLEVYIVDDHQIMIDGIKALLNNDKRFQVTGQNTSPVNALQELKDKQPDILITDINMKEMSGIELAKKIRQVYPDLKILALSMHGDRETISDMLVAGINGYVLKNTGMEELTHALTRISNGQLFFSDDVTAELMKAASEPKPVLKEVVSLTAREIEIVKLISLEMSNAQIGEKLFISERTVETHRKNIFRKTNTKSVAGLIKLAIEQKMI